MCVLSHSSTIHLHRLRARHAAQTPIPLVQSHRQELMFVCALPHSSTIHLHRRRARRAALTPIPPVPPHRQVLMFVCALLDSTKTSLRHQCAGRAERTHGARPLRRSLRARALRDSFQTPLRRLERASPARLASTVRSAANTLRPPRVTSSAPRARMAPRLAKLRKRQHAGRADTTTRSADPAS